MKYLNKFKALSVVVAALALGACADMPSQTSAAPAASAYPQTTNAYTQYGVVQSIDLVSQNTGAGNSSIGAGTIAGAVVGGILGNQVGGGDGNTVATVLGAAGGAYAGHQVEKNQRGAQQVNAYKLTVRLNNGSYQSVTQSSNADIRVGDRVQIDNGVARRY
ncbi:MAG: glycine zipper 2TM domain-containing protein [Rhodoferax sp.]|nr:glycine zipper 2TM domain-containing protein [Rhodoferax sp.]